MNALTLRHKLLLLCAICLGLLAACGDADFGSVGANPTATPEQPQPTVAPIPTRDPDFIVIATDAPLPPFLDFDQFGTIEGFDKEIMDQIAAAAGLNYEFVVTPSQGVLELLSKGETAGFDAVMSSLLIPENPLPGIAFTDPYLEVGQVLLLLADEAELQSPQDLRPGMPIGVQNNSQGELIARELLQIADSDLFNEYEKPNQVVQALIDETVRAVVLDSTSADYFVQSFPEQLRIAGGTGRDAWISEKSYGIAVEDGNTELLQRLNEAIASVQQNQAYRDSMVSWLILEDARAETIDPGESRVGTPADEFFIGVIGRLEDMDPATLNADFINWEIMRNTMSGLYMFDAEDQLQPALAADFPQISEDKLEYTIRLKEGLAFPDGTAFTAEDVRWSVIRSSRLGNFLVNGHLRDANEDNFADADAVQVIDEYTVKFLLGEPAAYFPSLLATPPFFPVSSDCYAEVADQSSSCGGLGPYMIASWEAGDRIRLTANPNWPGEPAPLSQNITVRFYDNVEDLRRSLDEFQSIDLAWTGLPYQDLRSLRDQGADGEDGAGLVDWVGPSTFKSYLIFEQSAAPWNNKKVRQAVSFAIDRQAIVDTVFPDRRLALRSPIPDDVPYAIPALPEPDPAQVESLMLEAGYTRENPLVITLWFVNDGRYSDVEEQYITTIAGQLEATGLFQVEVSGAAWDQFRVQVAQCGYPAFLLGWPTPGRPVDYLDPSSWIDFFVQETDSIICSNYESPAMDALIQASHEELDPEARSTVYTQIQELWADELPSLEITQEPRRALSLSKVEGVTIDALGIMHYEQLIKLDE